MVISEVCSNLHDSVIPGSPTVGMVPKPRLSLSQDKSPGTLRAVSGHRAGFSPRAGSGPAGGRHKRSPARSFAGVPRRGGCPAPGAGNPQPGAMLGHGRAPPSISDSPGGFCAASHPANAHRSPGSSGQGCSTLRAWAELEKNNSPFPLRGQETPGQPPARTHMGLRPPGICQPPQGRPRDRGTLAGHVPLRPGAEH